MGTHRRNAIGRSPAAAVAVAVAATAAVLAGCTAPSEPEPPEAIVLVVVDTLRPDRLSCYGYRGHETPAFDGVAEAGTLFRRAHSVASWTTPSMGSLLTSRYPTQLGLVERPGPEGHTFEWQERREQPGTGIPGRATTLAEILRDAGFRTAAFVNQPALNVHPSFARGFADWYFPRTTNRIDRRRAGEDPVQQRWPEYAWFAPHVDSLLVTEFDGWLARRGDDRVFAWVHLLTPHWPYAPTKEAAIAIGRGETDTTAFYDGEVRIVDGLVSQIVRSLREHVGEGRFTVVLTSDHGESLGERGMFEHGHSLHREVIEVPLILAGPGIPAGRVVETRVRTVDILPTIAELAGGSVAVPDGAVGESFVSEMRTGGDRDDADRPVYSEAMLYGSTERSLASGRHKVMYDAQGEAWSLYDLDRDPEEMRDLAAEDPERLDELRRSLVRVKEALAAERDTSAAPADREQLLEAMRSLGYVGR